MQAAFEAVIYGASPERQLQLISAHPDLAAKLDELKKLTVFSQAEQKRAGFAALPAAQLDSLRQSLQAYREKFGHPFIICVSEHQASEIEAVLLTRIKASAPSEQQACLAQVTRIGWHRLTSLVSDK